ncbi:MAG: AAA family ATPase, partial [Muribaculaceae bacterium]|nr:AAA family ATPase [Muribaculaceae bacterium]
MNFSKKLHHIFDLATKLAQEQRSEFLTPEHVVYVLLDDEKFTNAIKACNPDADIQSTKDAIWQEIQRMDKVPEGQSYFPENSYLLDQAIHQATVQVMSADRDIVDVPHLIDAILDYEDCWAGFYIMLAINGDDATFLRKLIDNYHTSPASLPLEPAVGAAQKQAGSSNWKDLLVCINDNLSSHNPLIGREEELERTIQVLCRKDKNNPLHIGEPGVGKTAIVYGLAQRIVDGKVPDALKGFRIYQLELGSLVAGTQFRGDFEDRINRIMKGIEQEEKAIVYIDEIHNLVGAGQTGSGSLDASNMLKPYLEGGKVRFIGATTYEEYNRNLARSKGLIRRFQTIDIVEPSIDETIKILQELKPNYEAFHHVKYNDDAIEFAVKASARYINDRYLPDKAIDLIDEAGAFVNMKGRRSKTVDKQLIADVLAKVSKIDALAMKENDNTNLENLYQRMNSVIYGQDEALRSVVEAVQLSKAGLTDETKPLASLLFVGPTGVGKTEVAKVLAKEMGVQLIRFDMSEYVEKHTVAKLIGSPAGYVGYEDGGLLTDAVRKSPDCVLLLDEIEKAHPDIFNILLQVMDYGVLTDNKGRKAFFRNVVLIMTSNAGAQFAAQASVGFASTVTTGSAMLKQVKKTFKPEFINRLSGIVVFNDMDRNMASLILDKKLRELSTMLKAKKVTMKLSKDAHEHLLRQGYSKEFGAREMDRVILQQLKTLLMREIL